MELSSKTAAEKTPRRCTPCRLCGLCMCILVLLIAATALSIYLLVKVPQVDYLGLVPGSIESSVDNLQLNATSKLRFQVHNPNPISLSFRKIEGTGSIPVYQKPIAFGELENVSFPKHETMEILFPLVVSYNPTDDKDFAVARYLIAQCAGANQMTVNFLIKFYFAPLSTFGIVPTFEKSSKVLCPDVGKISSPRPGA